MVNSSSFEASSWLLGNFAGFDVAHAVTVVGSVMTAAGAYGFFKKSAEKT